MQETPSSNSTATIGKEEPSRFEKIDMPTLAPASKVAKLASVEDLVQEVATAVVVMVLEEDLADAEAVSAVAEAATVEDSVVVEVDSRLVAAEDLLANRVVAMEEHLKKPQLPTPSPTSPQVVVSAVK